MTKPTSEYKVVAIRETAPPHSRPIGDTPEAIADYWRAQVETSDLFRPTVENCAVVFLNTRRRITGHTFIATGSLDTLLVHPREVFLAAILHNAAAVVFVHNHPSGDPTPSEADIKVTRDLMRAGQLLRIDVLDAVVMGHPQNQPPSTSLRALGYFYQ